MPVRRASSSIVTVLTGAVLWVAMAHRAGRIRALGRLAGFSERVSGLPGWAALPSAVTGGSLMIAVFGFYWDVAKHIDTGRDPSPFGTPAHYPILVGLFGIALGGVRGVGLGAGQNGRAAGRLGGRLGRPPRGCSVLPLRRAAGGGVLPARARAPVAGGRPCAWPQHAALSALHRRGAARGARGLADLPRPSAHARRGVGCADRHGWPGGRVGLVAPLDAAAMAV